MENGALTLADVYACSDVGLSICKLFNVVSSLSYIVVPCFVDAAANVIVATVK